MDFPKLTFGTPSVTVANVSDTAEVIAFSQTFSNLVLGKRYKLVLFAKIGTITAQGTASDQVTLAKGRDNAFFAAHVRSTPVANNGYQAYFEHEFVADEPQMKVQYASADTYDDGGTGEVIAINTLLIEGP